MIRKTISGEDLGLVARLRIKTLNRKSTRNSGWVGTAFAVDWMQRFDAVWPTWLTFCGKLLWRSKMSSTGSLSFHTKERTTTVAYMQFTTWAVCFWGLLSTQTHWNLDLHYACKLTSLVGSDSCSVKATESCWTASRRKILQQFLMSWEGWRKISQSLPIDLQTPSYAASKLFLEARETKLKVQTVSFIRESFLTWVRTPKYSNRTLH